MPLLQTNGKSLLLKHVALSSILVLATFLWEGNKGYSLWDEGYLWYGSQRVLAGEVPIRDFMAYDPGRYYWVAGFMALFGDHGIMALRVALALFQVLGVTVGLGLVARSAKGAAGKTDILYLTLSALVVLIWMFTRHKVFDISVSIFLVGTLSLLVAAPSARRYLLTGIAVGIAAIIGRNHGVYGLVGSLGVTLWLHAFSETKPGLVKSCCLLAAGVVLGFLPLLLALFLVPGLGKAFWESVKFIFEQGATNLPLPVPWPWKVDFSAHPFTAAFPNFLVGIFFIVVLTFGAAALAWSIYQGWKGKPVQPAFVGAAFMALPYAHFAFSRADPSHLAQGIAPLVLGALVFTAARPVPSRWLLAGGLFAMSACAVLRFHPGWQCAVVEKCVELEISGNRIEMDGRTASDVALLRGLAKEYAGNGRSFMAAPFWPGSYALLERRSPVWEIYPVFSRPASFQEAEISRLQAERPGFIIIIDQALDGRAEYLYGNSHPLVYQFILENYERLDYPENPTYKIYLDRRPGTDVSAGLPQR
ncbi:hypothetical protein [Achromobacter aloeverae]|nr:hypothetical protein [Achromobacter aloeverae]